MKNATGSAIKFARKGGADGGGGGGQGGPPQVRTQAQPPGNFRVPRSLATVGAMPTPQPTTTAPGSTSRRSSRSALPAVPNDKARRSLPPPPQLPPDSSDDESYTSGSTVYNSATGGGGGGGGAVVQTGDVLYMGAVASPTSDGEDAGSAGADGGDGEDNCAAVTASMQSRGGRGDRGETPQASPPQQQQHPGHGMDAYAVVTPRMKADARAARPDSMYAQPDAQYAIKRNGRGDDDDDDGMYSQPSAQYAIRNSNTAGSTGGAADTLPHGFVLPPAPPGDCEPSDDGGGGGGGGGGDGGGGEELEASSGYAYPQDQLLSDDDDVLSPADPAESQDGAPSKFGYISAFVVRDKKKEGNVIKDVIDDSSPPAVPPQLPPRKVSSVGAPLEPTVSDFPLAPSVSDAELVAAATLQHAAPLSPSFAPPPPPPAAGAGGSSSEAQDAAFQASTGSVVLKIGHSASADSFDSAAATVGSASPRSPMPVQCRGDDEYARDIDDSSTSGFVNSRALVGCNDPLGGGQRTLISVLPDLGANCFSYADLCTFR